MTAPDKFDEMARELINKIDDALNAGASIDAGSREDAVLADALRKLDAEARAEGFNAGVGAVVESLGEDTKIIRATETVRSALRDLKPVPR
jgi:hypothetical protein